jgi:heterodisulfide reductase subunit A-like polyferredoxin
MLKRFALWVLRMEIDQIRVAARMSHNQEQADQERALKLINIDVDQARQVASQAHYHAGYKRGLVAAAQFLTRAGSK